MTLLFLRLDRNMPLCLRVSVVQEIPTPVLQLHDKKKMYLLHTTQSHLELDPWWWGYVVLNVGEGCLF